jgi:hypothetical protein
MDLRRQCERELKAKLIWLRQGYISSRGDKKLLEEGFIRSITVYITLFRGIIALFGSEPPILQRDVVAAVGKETGVDTNVFAKVLNEKYEKVKLTLDALNTIFEEYYAATAKLGAIVDEIKE